MIQKSYSWAYIWRKTLIQNNTSTPVFTAALFTRAKTCMLSCFSRVQLCGPVDCSPPGSSVQGDPPGKNIGVGCYAVLQGIS